MTTIKDLTPSEVGRHAENVFLIEGRHQGCSRLVYHALAGDPHEPQALRVLSDLLSGDGQKGTGLEQFAAVVLEYAMRSDSPLTAEQKKDMDQHLFLQKWTWAFAKKKDGGPRPPGRTFKTDHSSI